jgi:hypothetical protein
MTSGQANGATPAFLFDTTNQYSGANTVYQWKTGGHVMLDLQAGSSQTYMNFYNPASGASEGSFISDNGPYLTFYGWTFLKPYTNNSTQFGGTTNYWAGIYSQYVSLEEQTLVTSGAVSITATTAGQAYIGQTGNITSLSIALPGQQQEFVLIITGNGSSGVTTIGNAILTGGVISWPGNAVTMSITFVYSTPKNKWVEKCRAINQS